MFRKGKKCMNRNNCFIGVQEGRLTINGQYWKNIVCDMDSEDILLFNTRHIEYNIKLFRSISENVFPNSICAFALKVAPHKKILEILKSTDDSFGVEVYNIQELTQALEVGCSNIVVDGYYKPYEMLVKSVEEDVFLINVDSFDEIECINGIAKKMGKCVNIGLRIKEDRAYKMGISLEEIKEKVSILSSYDRVNVVAVHMHPGSNKQDISKTGKLYANLLEGLDYLVNNNVAIKYVDIGGGYGELSNAGMLLEEYLSAVKEIFTKYSHLTFILEPGRAIVSDAGLLFCEVTSVNHFDRFVNVGIALSPFLCTTSATLEVDFPDYMNTDEGLEYSIAGIWPISSDIISKNKLNCKVPKNIESGDYIVIYNAGAYVLDRLPEYTFSDIEVTFI